MFLLLFSFRNYMLYLEDSIVGVSGNIPELRGHVVFGGMSKRDSNL